jgi:hypothetical protein
MLSGRSLQSAIETVGLECVTRMVPELLLGSRKVWQWHAIRPAAGGLYMSFIPEITCYSPSHPVITIYPSALGC